MTDATPHDMSAPGDLRRKALAQRELARLKARFPPQVASDHQRHGAARAGRISTGAERLFAARASAALRKRVSGPGAVSPKALAHACDVHPDTARQWIDGAAKMPGYAVMACAQMFRAAGDSGFLADLFDDLIEHPAETRLREARRAIEDAARLLGRDGGT